MNMTEIERIETKIPSGMRLELSQQQRDLLVARAGRERSEYIVSAIKKIARGLWQFLVPARGNASVKAVAPLRRQHQ